MNPRSKTSHLAFPFPRPEAKLSYTPPTPFCSLRRESVGALYLVFLLSTSGCGNLDRYFVARGLDLWDTVPVSVKYGYGLSVSGRATPFLQTGLGGFHAEAIGMGPGRWGPRWEESAYHIGIGSSETQRLSVLQYEGSEDVVRVRANPEDGRHCAGGPDWRYWFLSDPKKNKRYCGNGFVLIPVPLGDPPPFGYAHLPPWHSWLNVEADVFVGVVGVRAGLCLDEFVDFVAGVFCLDLLGDDEAENAPKTRQED